MQYPIIDLIADAYLNNGWTGLDVSTTGKNLVNQNTIVVGYWNAQGQFENNGDYRTSQFIEITPLEYYSTSLYDENFVFVNNLVMTIWDENRNIIRQSTSQPVLMPSNAKYAKVRNYVANSSIVQGTFYYQVEKGQNVTPYEPYSPSKNDFPNRLKLPLPHYFPYPVIDALQRAAAGTQTADDTEILRRYLTPLGIGGI